MNVSDRILIMGIGNVLMGDEGVGVHAVKRLEKSEMPDHVDLLDGGTGGFHLLSYLEDYADVIMIDATMDGSPAGTIALKRPRYSSDFPIMLSAHDIGLKDLIDAASFSGKLPIIHLITITIESLDQISIDLTEKIEKSLPEVEVLVRNVLRQITVNQEKILKCKI